MRFDPWGLFSMVALVGVMLVVRVAARRMAPDRRPDHHEEGRRVRDMTPSAKAVGVLVGAALVGVVVGRSLEPVPVWFWWCAMAVVSGAIFVVLSERRRVRRDPRLAEYRGAGDDPAADR